VDIQRGLLFVIGVLVLGTWFNLLAQQWREGDRRWFWTCLVVGIALSPIGGLALALVWLVGRDRAVAGSPDPDRPAGEPPGAEEPRTDQQPPTTA
jgi:uncharacterized membrane protein YhaH (DUF805 family)